MKNNRFIVYARSSGGMYLALRKRKDSTGYKYTWCKDRSRAVKFAVSDAANRVASRYWGYVKAV